LCYGAFIETVLLNMNQTGYIKSLQSAMDIINSFTFDNYKLGVSEIARKLGMNKTKVSRTLSTLAVSNMVIKSESSQKYRLGPKVLQLASIYVSRGNLRAIASRYCKELRRETLETVGVFIREGDSRVFIDCLESPQELSFTPKVGERAPLYAGAPGKLLLAHLPAEKRENLIAKNGLSRLTPHTIKKRRELEDELEKIRKQGFAVSFEERVPSSASIAVPIRDYTGEVISGLGIVGPAMRFTPEKIKRYAVLARKAGDEISRELGYFTR